MPATLYTLSLSSLSCSCLRKGVLMGINVLVLSLKNNISSLCVFALVRCVHSRASHTTFNSVCNWYTVCFPSSAAHVHTEAVTHLNWVTPQYEGKPESIVGNWDPFWSDWVQQASFSSITTLYTARETTDCLGDVGIKQLSSPSSLYFQVFQLVKTESSCCLCVCICYFQRYSN